MSCMARMDDRALVAIVDVSYARVRAADLIGPLLNDAVGDWPVHLERFAAFWSSVMVTTGRYKGRPVSAHLRHRDRITPPMFDRWLSLWRQTTAEMSRADIADALHAKVERIAESLRLAPYFEIKMPEDADDIRLAA